MPRLGHGKTITEKGLDQAELALAEAATESPLAFAVTQPVESHNFDFLFPSLQDDPANLLPADDATLVQLKNLGSAMIDTDLAGEDSPIPAAYTYFGQFVDHDITLESQEGDGSATMSQLLADDMRPLGVAEIRNGLLNKRTPTLDLDSVYGLPARRDPANGQKMRLGEVTDVTGDDVPVKRPPGSAGDDFHDLFREPPAPGNPEHDRAAVLGDPRNDENLIIAQLHVAFLRAHNALIDQGLSFEEARRVLRQHYQYIVLNDFLKRVADPTIVDDVIKNGNSWFDPLSAPVFMPLEFAVAGYRFGHTMVRAEYDFNINFNRTSGFDASLERLFTFTALSGELGNLPTLPSNWIIEWKNLIGDDASVMRARRIDPNLATFKAGGFLALFALRKVDGQPETPDLAARLAVRNLLRGHRLRLPTGQAVAKHLGVKELSKEEILAAAGNDDQRQALKDGKFEGRTPLWFYVLAEAKALGHNGAHLGPVGSILVAEVLVGLVRRSTDSILSQPGWTPALPAAKPGKFELADILRLAGVLGGTVTPSTYEVKPGDSLSRIAQTELGAANRWPQIYALNQSLIRNPDRVFVGQVFVLPPKTPVGTIPRLQTVKRGDTLSSIAAAKLGAANRWPEIFTLNRAILTNPGRVIPGQVLILPAS